MRPTSTAVAWSVCLSVCWAEMAEPIEMPFGRNVSSGGPKELCIRCGPRSRKGKEQFLGTSSGPL